MGHQTLFARDVEAKAQPSLHSLLSEAVYTKVAAVFQVLYIIGSLPHSCTLALPANQCLDGSLT